MSKKIQIYNGDCGLFFRNKLNKIKQGQPILETIQKWVGKEYRVSFNSLYKGKEQRNTTTFKLLEVKELGLPNKKLRKFELETTSPKPNNQKSSVFIIAEKNKEIVSISY